MPINSLINQDNEMTMLMKVLAAKDKTCVQESGKDVCYLTLGDKNPASGNRYYISISGEDSLSDWKNVDMVELEIVIKVKSNDKHEFKNDDAHDGIFHLLRKGSLQ